MRELLKQLHVETFLLDLKESQLVAPELGNYPSRLIDHHTLEVQVEKSQVSPSCSVCSAPVASRC